MEQLGVFISIVFPSAAVLVGMYLTVKTFLTKDFEKKLVEMKIKNNEVVMPLRIQAYERIALLLERIAPNNIVVMVNQPGMNVAVLQHTLLNQIKEEFGHNMAQQVYISDEVWAFVKSAIHDVSLIVNESAQGLDVEAPSVELAKVIFSKYAALPFDPVANALTQVKAEIRQLF
jgi:hypothetical protein